MNDSVAVAITEFLITYWLHSSVILGTLLMALKSGLLHADAKLESLLKTALMLGILSSVLSGFRSTSVPLVWPVDERRIESVQQNLATAPLTTELSDVSPMAAQTKVREVVSMQQRDAGSGAVPSVFDLHNWSVAELVALIWGLGMAWVGTAKLWRRKQLAVLLSDRQEVTHTSLLEHLHQVQQAAGFATRVKLSQSSRINSPLVYGRNEIVVPNGFERAFEARHQRAALAHELAHLKCRDMQWRRLMLWMEVVFFFQPLNRLLIQHIIHVVEQRSDLMACHWTGDKRALAEALSITAEINLSQGHTQWVSAMASGKSNLIIRVENLLLAASNRPHKRLLALFWMAGIAVLAAAPGLSIGEVASSNTETVATQQSTLEEPVRRHSYFHEADDDGRSDYSMHFETETTQLKVKASLSGDIVFSDDEKRILQFPTDSDLDIRFREGTQKRRLNIERDDEQTQYTYYLNGKKQGYDEAAQDWFSQLIPKLLRNSGWFAQQRVERILSQSGVEGVMDEIERIHSDYVTTVYFTHLLNAQTLSEAQLARAFDISRRIESDHEAAKLLLALSKGGQMSQRNWLALLVAAQTIESDFELSQLLRNALTDELSDAEVQARFFEVAKSVQSDHEMAQMLAFLFDGQGVNQLPMMGLLEVARHIESDHELSSLLIKQVLSMPMQGDPLHSFIRLTETISSDHEMQRLYSELLRVVNSQHALLELVDAAGSNIQSDSELASWLMKVIQQRPLNRGLTLAIDRAADSLSGYEKERVLKTLATYSGNS